MWNFPNTPVWDATIQIQADLKRVKSPSISVDINPFISFFSETSALNRCRLIYNLMRSSENTNLDLYCYSIIK